MIDEEKLMKESLKGISFDKSLMITSLMEVKYGGVERICKGLDIKKLTGKDIGIKFVDMDAYMALNINGYEREKKRFPDALMINILKTRISDPHNIYIAIKPDVNDSSLIHEIAHALDYMNGSGILPAFARAIALEFFIPLEHLEHTHEFGYWFSYLKNKFNITPDAEDMIICILYENGLLIKGEEIKRQDGRYLKEKSNKIISFLSENSQKIYSYIKKLPGYITTNF